MIIVPQDFIDENSGCSITDDALPCSTVKPETTPIIYSGYRTTVEALEQTGVLCKHDADLVRGFIQRSRERDRRIAACNACQA